MHSDRFVRKDKTFDIDIDGATFTVRHLLFGDVQKVQAIRATLASRLLEYQDGLEKINKQDTSEDEKERLHRELQVKLTQKDPLSAQQLQDIDDILVRYVVKIKEGDQEITDIANIALKESDVLALVRELYELSTLSEDDTKKSDASSSTK